LPAPSRFDAVTRSPPTANAALLHDTRILVDDVVVTNDPIAYKHTLRGLRFSEVARCRGCQRFVSVTDINVTDVAVFGTQS
jgi:hypothetical protein